MHAGQRHRRAMTLFELTIVVAIALILVALAVISTQSLIVRTKVSRVLEEHRIVTRALQNYAMDHADLPSSKQGLDLLVRPTAYLGKLPRDPFQGDERSYIYLHPNVPGIGCVLISPGPDGDFDLPLELWDYVCVKNVDQKLMPRRFVAMQYSLNAAVMGEAGGSTMRLPVHHMDEAGLAVLTTYITLGQYDPEKGEDGDIISVMH